jgi:hypothetical protein
MHKIVDQLDPFVLVIMPSFVLLVFFPSKVSWHPLVIKIFLISQNGSQDLFLKQEIYPKVSIYETTGT